MTSNIDNTFNVPTGFSKLDELISGLQPCDFVIIAGRPAMGKTAFALSLARNITIDSGYGVAYFSLELPKQQLFKRIITAEAGIDPEMISGNPDFECDRTNSKIAILMDAPLYIDDTAELSITQFHRKCLQLIEENGIRIVIIDYLQLMNETNENNSQENLNISRSLKEIANELNITVIALSQLYRPVQHRANRHPKILDLPDKNIAQYADIVAFIHRPEYYRIVVEDDEGNSLLGIAKIIIAKNRNGILGDVLLHFKSRFFKYKPVKEVWTEPRKNRPKRMRDHRQEQRIKELERKARIEKSIRSLIANSNSFTRGELLYLFNTKQIFEDTYQSHSNNLDQRIDYLIDLLSNYKTEKFSNYTHFFLMFRTSSVHPLVQKELDMIHDFFKQYLPASASVRYGYGNDESLDTEVSLFFLCSY